MTVVAVKDAVMAADTSSWHGSILIGKATKIQRIHGLGLVGGSGWKPLVHRALEWLECGATDKDRPAPAESGDLSLTVLRESGEIWNVTHKFDFYPCDSEIDAIGAHTEFLYGAMLAGASAEEAVRLALKHCQAAGGQIQVEHL